ncbi:BCCT family transporter, partial [Modicisalibacter tunisiensis]
MSDAKLSTAPASTAGARWGDPLVLSLTVGFILVFCILSLIDVDMVANAIGAGFAWTARTLGAYFQLLLLLTFFIAIGLAATPAAKARIGDL